MWHRFSPCLREAVLRAASEAEARGERDISTRHFLAGMLADQTGAAFQLLARVGVTPAAVLTALTQTEAQEKAVGGAEAALTAAAREAAERAYCLAVELQDSYIGSEHLLLSFVREPGSSDAGRVLTELGAGWAALVRALMAQQPWRTRSPEGVPVAGLRARRLRLQSRRKAGQVKRLAQGLMRWREPFTPYLLFPQRTARDPYPFYARLRRDPLYWDTQIREWVITGYEEAREALVETHFSRRTYSLSVRGQGELPPVVEREFRRLDGNLNRQMLFQDAPSHTRQRSLVARQFTPRMISRMKDLMQQTTDELLDAVAPSGRMEVVADLAFPMPMLVITRMLGVPSSEAAQMRLWSNHFIAYVGGDSDLGQEMTAYHSVNALSSYFQGLIAERRQEPQDDLITLLLQADDQGDRLTEAEVIANCLLILAAGHENSTRLIGNGLLALLEHPDQWQRLQEDPSCLPSAVEELLRYDSPLQWTARVAREDFEWRGQRIKKGQVARIGVAAANHDPSQFPDPDRLDIGREANRHLSFGTGSHFCLGAALTRLEGQVMFGTLLARFPRLRLAQPPTRTKSGYIFREIQALHVRWD